MCVPVRPSVSRRKWTRRRRGSTSASWLAPLTVTVMCWVLIVFGLLRVREGALDGRAGGPEGHLRSHRPLVFDGTTDVAAWIGLRRHGRAGLAEERLGRGIAGKDRFGIGRRER